MPLPSTTTQFRRLAVPVLAAVMLALPAGADRIRLKNGNTVEGIVSRETESAVLLQVGGGSVAFRRSQILAIERDPADSNTVMAVGWRSKFFLNRAYLPAGFEDLAARYRALDDSRRQAIDARQALRHASDTLHAIEQDLAKLQDEFLTANAELKALSPAHNTPAYNVLVARNNQLRAMLALKQGDLDNELGARPARMKTISAYLRNLQDCSHAVTTARQALSAAATPNEPARLFVDKLDAQVRTYAADFKRIDVPASLRGNATVIAVLVNGRAWGTFVVDTGAEIVTMGRAFAERAGVDLSAGHPANVVLADGTRLESTTVRLSSVTVGDVDTPGVLAAVLPSPPAPDVDGLLGMNVLNSFLVRLNPALGRLELEYFAPR